MSELRTRMIRDLTVRGLAPRTHKAYIAAVVRLAKHYRRSPDQITNDEVQTYLAYVLQQRKLSWSTCSQAANAFRFLYHVTLGHPRADFHVPLPKQPQKLPEILSREEVWRLLAAPPHPRHRLLLTTVYAAGLRVSEAIALRVTDIDADRMTIRIEQGKGAKDREVPLAARLLQDLRAYWKSAPPGVWLFANRQGTRPIDITVAQKIYTMATLRAGLQTQGGIHALHHAFATHLLEAGTDRHTVQRLLGHRQISTTMRYFQLSQGRIVGTRSPLDLPKPLGLESAVPSASAPAAAPRARPRPAVEVADILRAHGAAYRHTHVLSRAQRRAMRAIETCRTAALGGHRETCDTCGAERLADNSCRNRHCPKCQTLAKARWLAARRAELLPVEYFHVVFTLPHALNALAQGNPRVIYRLLCRAGAATLTTFGRDPRHLGGAIGGTAILPTWGQTLSQHLHLHCVVAGGALTQHGARWIPAPPGFLFPVRALAKVFRGTYLHALQRAFSTGHLVFAGSLTSLADPELFAAWLQELRQPDWIVYAQRPLAGPTQILEYLGRYTHRVALSNERLLSHADGVVRFRWKDYADGDRVKVMTLDVEEFIRRFLLHVVPGGFVRIRHCGFLANRTRRANLARCRALLAQPPALVAAPPESAPALMLRLTGIDIERCPRCQQGRLHVTEILAPVPAPTRPVPVVDTS